MEPVKHLLDAHYEEISHIAPLAAHLPAQRHLPQELSQLVTQLLLTGLGLPLERRELSAIFDDTDLVLDQPAELLKSTAVFFSHFAIIKCGINQWSIHKV